MSILVAERDTGAVWLWEPKTGRRQSIACGAAAPCAPAAAPGALLVLCARNAQVYCVPMATGAYADMPREAAHGERPRGELIGHGPIGSPAECSPSASLAAPEGLRSEHGLSGDSPPALVFPAMPGPCALCASPCGRYAYVLGEDADALHTRCLRTGELLFAQRAGVFPRGLRLHPNGRWLAVAGGASGEALVFAAPELRLLRKVRVRGAVCAVDFVADGLLLLCAAGESEPYTALVHAAGDASRTLWSAEGPPGDLRAVGHGAALAGAWGGLTLVSLREGRALWRRTELPLAGRIEVRGESALVSDTLTGALALLPLRQPWLGRAFPAGAESQACFVPYG